MFSCLPCCLTDEQKISKHIDKQIKTDLKEVKDDIKLLLLGTGESGKSTIMKQMKVIHQEGFTQDEREEQIPHIYFQMVRNMRFMLTAAKDKFHYTFKPAEEDSAKRIENLTLDFPMTLANTDFDDLKTLWQSTTIQQTYERQSEYQLGDSTKYFLDFLDRIKEPGYLPNDQDILRSRIKTTSIIERQFTYSSLRFRMYDVGGQRNERRKWIHCFENVNALVFVASLSEYDQTLFEDGETNRMEESLKVFDGVCNSPWFEKTSIILFLNKVDLFKEKLLKKDLRCCFPDYTGGNNFENAANFITQKYLNVNKNKEKMIYTRLTTATDTNNIRAIFEYVRDIIIKENINYHFGQSQ